eukprot:COSAG02_NODE_48373_length_334_cov_0.770213_1_plen_26_part_10
MATRSFVEQADFGDVIDTKMNLDDGR